MATPSAQSPSWTGNNIWIQDEWTDEDKSKARDQLASESQRQTAGQALTDFGRNASTNWNVFYQQNKTNFFKDRHYLHKAFPEEFGWLYDDSASDGTIRKDKRIVEIGCGVGNAILPLLEQHSELVKRFKELNSDASPPQLHIHALDFAPTAVKLLKDDPRFQSASKKGRATAHVYDASSMHPSTISIPGNPGGTSQQHTLTNSADIAILLFCLSAIGPHPSPALDRAARHACAMLKPGGTLLIRDYGRLDEAQMKLGRGDKELGGNFYRKGDGTGCYYFELDDLKELFVNSNALEILELGYIQRVYRNRGDGTTRRRVWVQGRFHKPLALNEVPSSEYEKGELFSPSADRLKQFLDTNVKRWDDHYSNLSSATPRSTMLPCNILQIFPDEFQPWQSPKNKGKRQVLPHQSTSSHSQTPEVTIFDIGCGRGNDTLLNLLEMQQMYHEEKQRKQQKDCQSPPSPSESPELSKPPILNVHFLDASKQALEKLHEDSRYRRAAVASDVLTKEPKFLAATVTSQVYDLTLSTQTGATQLEECADLILLLFTLSAIGPYLPQHLHPNHYWFVNAVQNSARMLKPGGIVLFRDFGRFDDDQLQLNSIVGARLCDNFYIRVSDDHYNNDGELDPTKGTGCYFFEIEEVRELFTTAGLEVLQLEYITRIYKKKSGKNDTKNGGAVERRRIWLHGRFRKPCA